MGLTVKGLVFSRLRSFCVSIALPCFLFSHLKNSTLAREFYELQVGGGMEKVFEEGGGP
jgi:hypothetical protein